MFPSIIVSKLHNYMFNVLGHFEGVKEGNDIRSFTLKNSFWFMIASLLQQGTDILPKSLSTRIIAGMWWFFCLITISSYTANLAAFLTIDRMQSPIESAEDLSTQYKIKYGCLKGGSTCTYFRNCSEIPTYKAMWSFMKTDDSNFVRSNKEGVERVLRDKGTYAFLMESTSIDFIIERECDLTQVGKLLNTKGYSIAMRKNSPYLATISSTILQLQETGKLQLLKNKWWKVGNGGGKCEEEQEKVAAGLKLSNFAGVYIVLFLGILIACMIACFERYHYKRSNALPKGVQVHSVFDPDAFAFKLNEFKNKNIATL